MRALLAFVLLAPAASAQTVALRPGVAALAAPAAPIAAASGAAAFAVVPALSAAPGLSAPSAALAASVFAPAAALAASAPAALVAPLPAAAAAPALAAAPGAARAAAAAESGKAAGLERAAASLAEFSRLVAELMGRDAAKSVAAAAELARLKDAHLNKDPEPEKTRVLDLKPMQIPAGMYEVQDKARMLRDMKAKEVDAWLREKSVPIVEDYKGRERPVDHHHEARAAWEADNDEVYTHRYFDREMHRLIKDLPRDQFYAVTRAMGLFYDRDQFGAGPHDPNHLPEDVRGLADDPYRSIAWQVRKRGGFDKSSVPFAEFQWAQFFRERLKTYPTRDDFEKSVKEAMALVHDPAAKGLPGYTPK